MLTTNRPKYSLERSLKSATKRYEVILTQLEKETGFSLKIKKALVGKVGALGAITISSEECRPNLLRVSSESIKRLNNAKEVLEERLKKLNNTLDD